MHKEKVPDSEWSLTGDGSVDDPIRPDIFDLEDDTSMYHFDSESEELYKIIPEEDN